jgi:hypothetical protein
MDTYLTAFVKTAIALAVIALATLAAAMSYSMWQAHTGRDAVQQSLATSCTRIEHRTVCSVEIPRNSDCHPASFGSPMTCVFSPDIKEKTR